MPLLTVPPLEEGYNRIVSKKFVAGLLLEKTASRAVDPEVFVL